MLSRFGGSFRKKKSGKEKKESPKDDFTIPAKLIKATSVQRVTLNPKWNEKFTMYAHDDYFKFEKNVHC